MQRRLTQRTAQSRPHPDQRQDPAEEAARAPATGRAYLLLGLRLLDVIPSHLDAGREDSSGEIGHVDTQEVGHFLGS